MDVTKKDEWRCGDEKQLTSEVIGLRRPRHGHIVEDVGDLIHAVAVVVGGHGGVRVIAGEVEGPGYLAASAGSNI